MKKPPVNGLGRRHHLPHRRSLSKAMLPYTAPCCLFYFFGTGYNSSSILRRGEKCSSQPRPQFQPQGAIEMKEIIMKHKIAVMAGLALVVLIGAGVLYSQQKTRP